MVVYERRFGRLMAHAFSYSGNPQGCDHVIRHLHTALENLQAKLSHHATMQPTGAVPSSPATLYGSPASSPATPIGPTPAVPFGPDLLPAGSPVPAGAPSGSVIPLTPAEPGH